MPWPLERSLTKKRPAPVPTHPNSQTRSIIPDDPSKFDHFLGALAPALAILKGVSEIPGIPALKGAADIALTFVEILRSYRANQTGSLELVYHAVYLTVALCDDCPESPNEKVGNTIQAFTTELEAIVDNMEKLSSKSFLKAFLGTKTYADKIKANRDSLNMAYKRFLISLDLDTNQVVSRMEQQGSRIEQGIHNLKRDTAEIISITSATQDTINHLKARWVFTRTGGYALLAILVVLISLTLNTNRTTSVTKEATLRIEDHSAESKQATVDIKQDTGEIKRDTADIKEQTWGIRRSLEFRMEQNFIASLPPVVMPPKPEIFYGREEYVERVVDVILKPNARVAILGPGGIGKTSVALAVMQDSRVKSTFKEEHRYWVPCEKATSPELLVELLAKSVNASKTSNDRLKDIVNTLQMSEQRQIILLDNLETLLDIEGKRSDSESILHTVALPNVNILVTMRGALPPSTRFRWVSHSLRALSLDAARKTFVAIYPESTLDDRLDELLLALDCVPLAVNLMAAIGGLGETPTELLGRWKEERTLLLHIAPDRQNSVDHSIRISLESSPIRLNPEALQLLAILSMLPGGVQQHLLKEVAPSIKNLHVSIRILLRVSLAIKRSDTDSIHVLSPIRSYMLHHHKLDPLVREDIYKSYYAMAKWGDCFGEPQFVEAIRELSKEEANLESILLDALQHGDPYAAITASLQYSMYLYGSTPRMTVILAAITAAKISQYHSLYAKTIQVRGEMYFILGYRDEARADLQTARSMFQQIGSPLEAAQCLASLGGIHRMQGHYNEAQLDLQMAREEFQESGDLPGAAQCLRSLGDIRLMQGQYDEAGSYLQLALEQFQQINAPLGAAHCLSSLGDIHRMQGRYDEANSHFQMAREQFEQIGHLLGAAQCLHRLGSIHRLRGHYDQAWSDLHMAREQFKKIGEPSGAVQCLQGLGEVRLMQGRYDEARSDLQMALEQFQQLGEHSSAAQCLRDLGDIHRMQGRYDEARSGLQTAQEHFQRMGERRGAAQCLRSLGEIHLEQGHYDEARADLQVAQEQFQLAGDLLGAAQCVRGLAAIHGMQGRYNDAQLGFQVAQDKFQEIGYPLGVAKCLLGLGEIHGLQGHYDEARAYLKVAREQFQKIGDLLGAARCLKYLGWAYLMQESYDEAQSDLQLALEEFKQTGDQPGVTQCREGLQYILVQRGRSAKAVAGS